MKRGMTAPPPIMLPVALEVGVRLLASLEGVDPVELLKRLVRDEVASKAPGLDGYLKGKLARFQAGLDE